MRTTGKVGLRVIKWWERHKAKVRLKKIENAIGLHLMPMQREVCLNPQRPVFKSEDGWGRGSGKTLTACVWTLMWRKEPIYFDREQMKLVPSKRVALADKVPAIPDADANTYQRLEYLYRLYLRLSISCIRHGIQVETVSNYGRKL